MQQNKCLLYTLRLLCLVLAIGCLAPASLAEDSPVPGETDFTVTGEITPPPMALSAPGAAPSAEGADGFSISWVRGFTLSPVEPGETFTLALPVSFTQNGRVLMSHLDDISSVVPYRESNTLLSFSQSIADFIPSLQVDFPSADNAALPLSFGGGFSPTATVIDARGNHGYAVFSDITVSEGAQAGEYPLSFTVRWREGDLAEEQSIALEATLTVLPGVQAGASPTPSPAASPTPLSLEAEDDGEPADPADATAETASTAPPLTAISCGTVDLSGVILQPRGPGDAGDEVDGGPLDRSFLWEDASTAETDAPLISLSALTLRTAYVGQATELVFDVAYGTIDDALTMPDGQAELAGVREAIDALSITLDAAQILDASFPFAIEENAQITVELLEEEGRAVARLTGVSLKDDVLPGEYTLRFDVAYTPPGQDVPEAITIDSAVTLEHVEDACACCPHCSLCYDEDGRRLSDVCACLSEEGAWLGCGCDCPYIDPADPLGRLTDCGCGCHAFTAEAMGELSPEGLLYTDRGGVLVFSFEQLSTAVAAGYAHITIGYSTDENTRAGAMYAGQPVNNGEIRFNNLPAYQSLEIPAQVTRLTIDGNAGNDSDQENATLRNMLGSSLLHRVFRPSAEAGFEKITFVNLNIETDSEFGVFYGDVEGNDSIRVDFTNCAFTGNKLVHSTLGGTVTLTNCDLTASQSSALVAADTIVLAGDTALHQPRMTGDAVLALAGENNLLSVAEGATVEVRSDDAFLRCEGSGAVVSISGSLSLITNAHNGCFTLDNALLGRMSIEEAGSLSITGTNTYEADYPAIALSDTLAVRGSLTINRYSRGETAALWFDGGELVLSNPERFAIMNAGGPVLAGADDLPLSISTKAINVWTPETAALEDTLDNMPANIWNNNATAANILIGGTLGDVQISGLDRDGRGASPTAEVLTGETLGLSDGDAVRRLVLGEISVDVIGAYRGETRLVGITSASQVRGYEYRLAGEDAGVLLQRTSPNASMGGSYTLTADTALGTQGESVAYVLAYHNGLKAYGYSQPQGVLEFALLPRDMAFEKTMVRYIPQTVRRSEANWSLTIRDTRGVTNESGVWQTSTWVLLLSMETPLSAENEAPLNADMVYVKDGVRTPLGEASVPIATGSTTATETTFQIAWEKDEGVLIDLPPGAGKAGVSYSTTLTWTLPMAP